jgi:hypothetical protein
MLNRQACLLDDCWGLYMHSVFKHAVQTATCKATSHVSCRIGWPTSNMGQAAYVGPTHKLPYFVDNS